MEDSGKFSENTEEETSGIVEIHERVKHRNNEKKEEFPPVHYQPFNALEELRAFRKERRNLSPQEARVRFDLLKQRTLEQEQGIANTTSLLHDICYANATVTPDLLRDIVEEAAESFQFTEKQRSEFLRVVDEASERHAKVEIYKELPPEELYELCFKKRPRGAVQVLPGLVTLHIICSEREDYLDAAVYSQTKGTTAPTEEDLAHARRTGGMALREVALPELRRIITIGDTDSVLHEEQHQLNSLFVPLEETTTELEVLRKVLGVNGLENSPATKEKLLHQLLRSQRMRWGSYFGEDVGVDARARDEILAFYSNSALPDAIKKELTEHPVYDYKKILEKLIPQRMQHALLLFVSEKIDGKSRRMEVSDDIVNPLVQEIFEQEYKQKLQEWTGAITQLEEKGYTQGEVLSHFLATPVNTWKRLAERLPDKRLFDKMP